MLSEKCSKGMKPREVITSTKTVSCQTDDVFTIKMSKEERIISAKIFRNSLKILEQEHRNLKDVEIDEDDDSVERNEKLKFSIKTSKKWIQHLDPPKSLQQELEPAVEKLGFLTNYKELDDFLNERVTDPSRPDQVQIIRVVNEFINSTEDTELAEKIKKVKNEVLEVIRCQYLEINMKYYAKKLMEIESFYSKKTVESGSSTSPDEGLSVSKPSSDSELSDSDGSEDSEEDSDEESDEGIQEGEENTSANSEVVVVSTPVIGEIEEKVVETIPESIEDGKNQDISENPIIEEVRFENDEEDKVQKQKEKILENVEDGEEIIIESTPIIREIKETSNEMAEETASEVLNSSKNNENEKKTIPSVQPVEVDEEKDVSIVYEDDTRSIVLEPKTSTPRHSTAPTHEEFFGFRDFEMFKKLPPSGISRKRRSGTPVTCTLVQKLWHRDLKMGQDRQQPTEEEMNRVIEMTEDEEKEKVEDEEEEEEEDDEERERDPRLPPGLTAAERFLRISAFVDSILEARERAMDEENVIVLDDEPLLESVGSTSVITLDENGAVVSEEQVPRTNGKNDEIICDSIKRKCVQLYRGPHHAPPFAPRHKDDTFPPMSRRRKRRMEKEQEEEIAKKMEKSSTDGDKEGEKTENANVPEEDVILLD